MAEQENLTKAEINAIFKRLKSFPPNKVYFIEQFDIVMFLV